MTIPVFKTVAQQKLEWLESLDRPLTDEESEALKRAMHAVYCRTRRFQILAEHRREEMTLLARVEKEATQQELYRERLG